MLLERRQRRRLEDARISERCVWRQDGLHIGGKVHGRPAARPGVKTKPAVDKRIEHQIEKLIHQLEGDDLRTGRDFAVDLRQPGCGEIGELRGDAAGCVEVIGQCGGNALLVHRKAGDGEVSG